MALPNAVRFVETAALGEADKAAILGVNAARLLKIKPPKAPRRAKSQGRRKGAVTQARRMAGSPYPAMCERAPRGA